MQIQIEKPIFEEALGIVSKGVNARSHLPILSHVLLETHGDHLRVRATDLDMDLRLTVPAIVAISGAVCVPCALLREIVGKLPGVPITLISEEGRIQLTCGRSKFTVTTLPAEKYPAWQQRPGEAEINIPQEVFRDMVGHTIKATATSDESRSVMTGLLVEIEGDHLVMVATDGRRLAFARHALPDGLNQQETCIVPGRAMTELARACTDKEGLMDLRLAHERLWATVRNLEVGCRLLCGAFPAYRRVIPTEFQRTCRVGREALTAGLRRILVMARERQSPDLVVFDFDGSEKLELSSNTPDVGMGVEEIPVVFEGRPLRIAFNGKYVLDALGPLGVEEVEFALQDDTRGAVLRELGGEAFLHVLMPVRLREVVVEEAEQQEVVAV